MTTPRDKASTRDEAAVRRAVVDWALSQVGTTDSRAADGAEGGPVDAWQREFGLQCVDWCGCFVGYALRTAGRVQRIDRRVAWVPCVLADAGAGAHGWRSLVAPHEADAGDAALYCWDGSGVPGHIGLVVANHVDERAITAVEGNTTSGSEGDQARGGGVFVRRRPYSTIVACASPEYVGLPPDRRGTS